MNLKEFFEKWWMLFIGIFFGALDKINNDRLVKINNLVMLLLMIIGLIRWFKSSRNLKCKKKNNLIDTAVKSQKPFKAINQLTDPFEKGQQVGQLLEDVTVQVHLGGEKMKKFFEKLYVFFYWVGHNWHSLFASARSLWYTAIANVVVFTEPLYEAFPRLGKYELYIRIIIPVVTILLFVNDMYIYIKRSFDSNATSEEMKKEKLDVKSAEEEKEKKLKEAKEKVDRIKVKLDEINVKINGFTTELKNLEEDYAISPTLAPTYESDKRVLANKISALTPIKEQLEKAIETLSK